MREAATTHDIEKMPVKRINGVKPLAAVSLMHFMNDLHPTMLPTFLPEIVKRLSLTLGEAGLLSTVFGMLNLLVQPFAGHFADKVDRPAFALWAPVLTASGACLLLMAPSYGAALIFVCVIGFGTANFHPQGHGLSGLAGGRENLGVYLAVFSAAGTLGAALSPLYAVFLLRTLGPSLMPVAILAPVMAAHVAKWALPAHYVDEGRRTKAKGNGEPAEKASNRFFKVLIICLPITIISLVRDSTSQGIRVFLPLLVTGRGGSLELGGVILFAFTVAGAVSSLIGGKMADLFGKRRVIIVMLVLAPLFLFPAVRSDGMSAMILFVLGGACISATSPVTLAMAQEYVPESRSTASSLVMGISWGVANMVASPIGALGDRIGLERALCLVALSPLLVVAAMLAGDISKRLRTSKRVS